MPIQPYPYIAISGPAGLVVLSDGNNGSTNYPPVIDSWGPSITGLRTSQLGGSGPYADVQEDLTCNIVDTTADLAWGDLDVLTRLLDQAERWWLRTEPISPVILRYVPQGSTLHSSSGAVYLQAIILGRVGTDELNGVDLPQSTNNFMGVVIRGVRVLIMRRGAWTGTSDVLTASGSAANPSVMTRTFATLHQVNSPVNVTIGGFNGTSTPNVPAGYLITGSASTDIQIIEAEGATASGFTSVADAAANARGGNVLRYTGLLSIPITSGTLSFSVISGPIAIIAAMRNNNAATTYQVAVTLTGQGPSAAFPTYTLDGSSTLPRLVLLGTVNALRASNLTVTITASDALSHTMDIDYFIIVNLRDETVNILAHGALPVSTAGAGAVTLDAIFDPTADQYPRLQLTGTNNIAVPYDGVLPIISTPSGVSSILYAVWTSTAGTTAGSWRFTTTAPAVMNATLATTRFRSYLSPR